MNITIASSDAFAERWVNIKRSFQTTMEFDLRKQHAYIDSFKKKANKKA